jgi:hypothetical protein
LNSISKALDFLRLLKVRSVGNINYQNIAIIGFFSGWILYNRFERNWIPVNLIIGIVIISAVGTTFIFIKFYKTRLGLIWSIFHNLTIGLLVAFLFMKSNDFLSSEPTITEEYYITDLSLEHGTNGKGSSSGLKPKISVEINGMSRNFTLHPSRSKNATQTRKVIIGIKKGFWNYNIVKSLKLANEE